MNKFAERLKDLREERGLSQNQLAKLAGVSQVAISMWEKNLRTPTIDNVITLAKIFNVSADFLIGLTDE